MSEPLTPAEAYAEVLTTGTGEILALASGWLVAISETMATYPSIEDVPAPLREFLEKVQAVADAVGKARVFNAADIKKGGSE